jgi:hypothetical protein
VLEPAVYSGGLDRAGRVNMPEENKTETLSPEMTGATRSAETACALIRKTKRATRRRFPTEEKIALTNSKNNAAVFMSSLPASRHDCIERTTGASGTDLGRNRTVIARADR